MKTKKRELTLVLCPLVALALLGGPASQDAEAQMAIGPQASWGSESDVGVGGRVLVNLPNTNLEAVVSGEVFFPDGDADWIDVNANLFYHFHLADTPTVMPYLGGGLNVARLTFNGSTTEAGLNLGGGIRFPGVRMSPFLEARAVISDADQFVVSAGILFGSTWFR